MKKVLFIESVHEILNQRLVEMGYQCDHFYEYSREQLLSILPSYDGLVMRSRMMIDREWIDASSQLKWIARSGSGLEIIDVEYAKSKRIAVISSPEGNRDAVGEHVIGMLLSLFNHLRRADSEVRQGQWRREANRGLELKGKTVGIVGYGMMGSGVAEKLSGFGCRIMAYDKYKTGFGTSLVEEVYLDELMLEADIVSLHLPQTTETFHYFNDYWLGQMKKPFYLVNTARGKNVDTSALVRGLKSGKILGACLDVVEYEKASLEGLGSHSEDWLYLTQAENVILTPHVAGWTVESYYKLSSVLADKIQAQFHS